MYVGGEEWGGGWVVPHAIYVFVCTCWKQNYLKKEGKKAEKAWEFMEINIST